MKGHFNLLSHGNLEGERYCAVCGTSLQAGRNAGSGWSFQSLLPAGTIAGTNVCPACSQRHLARRIGAVVSARV